MMKIKLFCVVLCASVFFSCEKEPIIPDEPVNPPVEQPEEPEVPDKPEEPGKVPSTENIVKTKIGDINMIVGSNTWNAIAHGNGRYVAVGGGGYITTSIDGVNWVTPKQVETTSWYNIVFGNGKFVALSSKCYITTSADGVTWTPPKYIGYDSTKESWTGMAYGNGTFVIIGITLGEQRRVITSTDGITWTSPTHVGGSPWWKYIAHDGSKFLAICDMSNAILASADGTTWSIYTNIGNLPWGDTWFNIAHENGKYIAVGTSGYIATSTNGQTWTTPKQVGVNDWYDATYRNGKFIAVGTNGCITISIDGENWAAPKQIKDESGNTVTAILRDICLLP